MTALKALLDTNVISLRVTVDDKTHALEKLSELLGQGAAGTSTDEILGSLVRRERMGSTGVGRGAAIPHGRIGGLDEPCAALLSLEKPIDFDASDEQSVDLLFGLMVPAECTSEHLQLLAEIAEMLTDEALCTQLRKVSAADDALSVIGAFQPE